MPWVIWAHVSDCTDNVLETTTWRRSRAAASTWAEWQVALANRDNDSGKKLSSVEASKYASMTTAVTA